ncbi:hypothetical protein BGO17_02020 [Candidatus Saccharibacteria bacterium 49-20]|nr:MAG: hypothetical protein BGO17_02020 [Candidatus Saccharibacteria bacterium 49-20]
MNLLTIIGGLAVIGLSVFTGFIAITLFIQGGLLSIFGGVALSIVTLMMLVLGIVLIGIGCAGIVARIRSGK